MSASSLESRQGALRASPPIAKTCPNCRHDCFHRAATCEACGWCFLTKKLPPIRRNRFRSRYRPIVPVKHPTADSGAAAAELHHGDCVEVLRTLPDHSIDLLLTDPPYPCIERDYGTLTEREWHILMAKVVHEARRVLKPTGSAVFILQPNSLRVGKMRLWLWEFLLRTARR